MVTETTWLFDLTLEKSTLQVKMEHLNSQEDSKNPPLERIRKSYKYEKHLENNVLRNAISSGYFNSLTVEDILGQYNKSIDNEQGEPSFDVYLENGEVRIKDKREILDIIAFLDLRSLKLRTIAEIGVCPNLTVCDLSCNFLEKIDALRACKCLRKLDLHQNQLIKLPEKEFWSELINLQVLYMHDNGISSLFEVIKMSAAPNLLILTLYDTPVSLKVYYRHFIANSIWPLKALDNVVLSDEEIIEDARFSERFQAMQPQFFFKVQSFGKQKKRTSANEIKALQMDIAVVNRIQAKHCPVLILQRFTRGFLARLRYHYELDKRLWAAVTIQRAYRAYCGTSVEENAQIGYNTSLFNLISKHLDYDTYARYRRSRDRVFAPKVVFPSVTSKDSSLSKLTQGVDQSESKTVKSYTEHVESFPLRVTIASMISDALLSNMEREASFQPDRKSRQPLGKPSRVTLLERQENVNQGMQKLRINDGMKSRQKDEIVDDSEDGPIAFRLVGLPAPKMTCDLMEDLMKCIVQGARDIREHAREEEMKRAMIPRPVVKKIRTMTADQKLFIRTHGTMSLSCLRAVDEAYKDRDRAKSLAAKIQENQTEKQRRDLMIKQREHMRHVFVENLQGIKNEAKNQRMEAMKLQELERLAKKESVATKRRQRERKLSMRKRAIAYAAEFCNQANALNKTLGGHATMTAKERRIEEKREKVTTMKDDIGRQKEIIKRYNEHRNLLLRAEVSLCRSKLETDLHERSVEYNNEMKRHVQKLRGERPHTEVAFPPICAAPSQLPPLAVVAETQMKAWEEMPRTELKPREHDRVNIWLS